MRGAVRTPICLTGSLPGWRVRRGFAGRENCAGAGGWDGEKRRAFQCQRGGQAKKIELVDGFLGRLFALGLFALFNGFAQFTRVLAIEGFDERLREGGIMSIADGHPNPRH